MKITLVLLCMLMLAGTAPSFAQDKEEFRGIKWGAPLEDFKDQMTLSKNSPKWGEDFRYTRKEDDLNFAGVPVRSIEYGFWRDRFNLVIIVYKGESNFNKLKEFLFKAYGVGERLPLSMEKYVWNDLTHTGIIFEYNNIQDDGNLLLYSRKLTKPPTVPQK